MHQNPGLPSLSATIVDTAGKLAEQLASPSTETRIAAISLILTLDRLADRALHAVVQDARQAGFSWQQVGDITGTSRQGAAQRFGTVPPEFATPLVLAPLPDALPRAERVVTAFLAGDYERIRPQMAKSMAATLTESRLAAIRNDLTARLGTLQVMDSENAEVSMLGDLTVVRLPLRLARSATLAKITFTPDVRLLGFWIDPVSPQQGAPDRG